MKMSIWYKTVIGLSLYFVCFFIILRFNNRKEPKCSVVCCKIYFENLKKQINSTFHRHMQYEEDLPFLYIITPTYKRAEQIAELTRLGQTLLHVRNLVWLVVEDAHEPTPAVLDYLKSSGLVYVYLKGEMPAKYRAKRSWPKGVSNRNRGIEWIRENATDGVVYFADDDNTYDLRIFEEIRTTEVISMFPVGLITHYGLSTPVVRDGKVIDYFEGWIGGREFPIDMAGFAVSVWLLKDRRDAFFPYTPSLEETIFIQRLIITRKDIEPKAQNCTKIWVWHTKTNKNAAPGRVLLKPEWQNTNLDHILSSVKD